MVREIDPKETKRAMAFEQWMKAPNPTVTLMKTMDVTNLVRVGRKKSFKFNMLMDYCIGRAASDIEEFYTLPVGDRLMRYDTLAVCHIVKNKKGGVSSCDILAYPELEKFNREYLECSALAAGLCRNRDLTDSMVIGTSAVMETELDGIVGMYSGLYNNPFLFWGRYRKNLFRYYLPLSFQFHHTQMDGEQAGRFLENLQKEINGLLCRRIRRQKPLDARLAVQSNSDTTNRNL